MPMWSGYPMGRLPAGWRDNSPIASGEKVERRRATGTTGQFSDGLRVRLLPRYALPVPPNWGTVYAAKDCRARCGYG